MEKAGRDGRDVLALLLAIGGLVLLQGVAAGLAGVSREVLIPVVALGASLLALDAGLRPGRDDRVAWLFVTAMASAWTVGEVIVAAYGLAGLAAPTGGIRETAQLAALVPAIVAFLLFAPGSRVASRIADVLDGLLIGSSLLLLSWSFVLGPLASLGAEKSVAIVGQALGHFVLVSMAIFVATRSTRSRRRVIGILALGVVLLGVADSVATWVGLTGSGPPSWAVETVRLAAYGFVAVACRRGTFGDLGSSADDEDRPSLRRVLLPYLPAAAAGATAATKLAGSDLDTFLLGNLAAIVGLLILRQLVLLVDHVGLTAELDARVESAVDDVRTAEARYRALVRNAADVITLVDTDGVVSFQSEASTRVFGHPPKALVGSTFTDWVHAGDRDRVRSLLIDLFAEVGGARSFAARLQHQDGRWVSSEVDAVNLCHETAVGAIVVSARDVSERLVLQRRLDHQASFDALTGLPNRSQFVAILKTTLDQQLEPNLVLLDLDRFGDYNTSLGQPAGDRLLQEVAGRIRLSLRSVDVAAQIGADEFALLLLPGDEGSSRHEPVLDRVAAAVRQPMALGADVLEVTFAAGVVLATPDDDPDVIMAAGGAALAAAKLKGRSGRVVFDEALASSEIERLRLSVEFRDALGAGELALVYQPTVRLTDERLESVEASVQWDHPTRGVLESVAILEIADAAGLSHELAQWTLTEVCRVAESLPKAIGVSRVSISVGAAHLSRLTNAVGVAEELRPGSLAIEVLGAVAAADADDFMSAVTIVRGAGISIGTDDVRAETLLSSRATDFAIVGSTLVGQVDVDERAASIVASLVELAHSAGVPVVARGVDRESQVAILRTTGCDLARGRAFGRPMSQARFEAVLRTRATPA